MTSIELQTEIASDIHTCFDLSLDVDIHKKSMSHTNEEAVAGRTSGVCELGDTITWQATHFGIRQRLSVKITQLNRPSFFEDEMTKGAFASMRHEHHFEYCNGKTIMTDKFMYEVPMGFIGRWFDKLILEKYMTKLLTTRNNIIKQVAEEIAL